MNKCLLYIAYLVGLLLVCESVRGQERYGTVIVRLYSVDQHGEDNDRIPANVVTEICTTGDTLHQVANQGIAFFERVPVGSASLRITHINIKPQVITCEIKPGEVCNISVKLEEKVNQIKEITVNGVIPVMTQHGDTLIYNAAAIRTLEGDVALDIIEQLPGVAIAAGKVTVLGEEIARTYIDGRLIFGKDPMTALENLQASDVIKIRTYNEYADRNVNRKHRRGDKQERVFDIETRSKLIGQINGEVIGSYGADIGQTGRDSRNRYAVGFTASSFSEGLQAFAGASFNNVGRSETSISRLVQAQTPPSAYTRQTKANINLSRNWQTATKEVASVSGYYRFSDDYSRSQSTIERLYFPAADYTSRTYTDTTRNVTTSRKHRTDLAIDHPNVLGGKLRANQILNFTSDDADGLQSAVSILDGNRSAGNRQQSMGRQNGYDLQEHIAWDMATDRRFSAGVGAWYHRQDGDGTTARIDTLTSTTTRQIVHIASDDLSTGYQLDANVYYKFSKERKNDLRLSYVYSYDNSRSRQMALDLSRPSFPQTDTINTHNFTNRTREHRAATTWEAYFTSINLNVKLDLTYKAATLDRDESFPEMNPYNNRFQSVLPAMILWSACDSKRRRVNLFYTTSTLLPSLEQLRPRLDNTNPYWLTGGNPKLQQSYVHNILSEYEKIFGEALNTINIQASARFTRNPIVWRTQFFAEATRLPEWDYTAPAQSTLTTYENGGGATTADGRIQFKRMIRTIRCNLDASIRYAYENVPSYIGDRANRTRSHIPGADLGLKSNFSDKVRLTLGAAATYVHSENTASETDKYCRTSLSAGLELPVILRHLYFNARYNAAFYNRFGGRAYNTADHILNLAFGCKFLKRRADLSVVIYDVLNRNAGFQTAMYSDYVQNRWSYSFGRYFTVNLGYKFSSTRSGK